MPTPTQFRTMAFQVCDSSKSRIETFRGQEYTVVPVVALVEGVLQGLNAQAPEFAGADAFGKFPMTWNGRPITLGHPRSNGALCSANTLDVLEEYSFGFMTNTFVEDGKLKCEAWLNNSIIEEKGEEFQEVLEAINSDELIEVSTGLFCDIVEESGTWNGKSYKGIWANVVPDHLAFLPKGTIGACSVADGCGAPRLNSQLQTQEIQMADTTVAVTEVTPTTMPTSSLNAKLPGLGSTAGKGAAATSDGQSGDTSKLWQKLGKKPSKTTISLKPITRTIGTLLGFDVPDPDGGSVSPVSVKMPPAPKGLTTGDNAPCCDACANGEPCVNVNANAGGSKSSDEMGEDEKKKSKDIVSTLSSGDGSAGSCEDDSLVNLESLAAIEEGARAIDAITAFQTNQVPADMSFNDVTSILQNSLRDKFDRYCYAMSVTSDMVAFSAYDCCGYTGSRTLAINYSIDDQGGVTFTGQPVPVNLITKIVAVPSEGGDGIVDMATTGSTQQQEGSPMTTNTDPKGVQAADVGGARQNADGTTTNATQAPRTLEQHLAELPPEMADVLREGIALRTQKKNDLIRGILANASVFEQAELERKDIDELTKLHALSTPKVDYSGRAFPTVNSREGITGEPRDNQMSVPEPIKAFTKKHEPSAATSGTTVN